MEQLHPDLAAIPLQMLVWAGYNGAILLLGARLLSALGVPASGPSKLAPVAWLSIAYALALVVMGELVQALALAGWATTWPILGVLAASCILGWPSARDVAREVADAARSEIQALRHDDLLWRILVASVAFVVSVHLALAWHGPRGDAIAYYLVLPKLVAVTGRFVHVPGFETFSQFGLGAQMVLTGLMALGGELSAKLTIWTVALACTGMLWAVAAEVGLGRLARWVCLGMVWTSSAFNLIVWDGKTDLFATLLGLVAIFWALRIITAGRVRVLCLTGLFTGFAMIGKLSFIPVLGALLLVLLLSHALREENRPWQAPARVARRILWMGVPLAGCALVAFVALAVKNAVVYGEPLAPFFVFGETAVMNLSQDWYSPEATQWIVMTYPFALAFGQYPQQGGNMSPFWLAALPFAVLVPRILWRNYRGLLWLTLASVLAVVVWVALRPSTLATRFILPAILALFPFAGLLVEQTWDRRELKWLRFLLPLLLIFMLLDAGTREAGKVYRSANYWIHGEEVASPSLGQAFRNVNDRAAPGDRVIMLTYYSYHLRTDLIQCMLPFLHVADLRRIGQEVTWEDVYRKGARFVVVEESYQTGWPDDSMTIPKWLTIDEIYNDGGWRVLQLSPHNGAPTPEWMCRPDGSVWRVVAFDR